MKQTLNQLCWTMAAMVLATSVQLATAFYDPSTQRWINRDPVGERGGVNLLSFARNQPSGIRDNWGHSATVVPPIPPIGPALIVIEFTTALANWLTSPCPCGEAAAQIAAVGVIDAASGRQCGQIAEDAAAISPTFYTRPRF
jgi:hypothetical protein